MKSFKILSWNINGLRSLKRDLREIFDELQADIICFQETKITRDLLEEALVLVEGYNSFFSFSRKRNGYSGVATFCKKEATPSHAQEGLGGTLCIGELKNGAGQQSCLSGLWDGKELKDLDAEGRCIITQHPFKDPTGNFKLLSVINVYCPRADPDRAERAEFKMNFYRLLRCRATSLRKSGSHVVILGDLNTSHKRIDHCDPDEDENFELREDRLFLDDFIEKTVTNVNGEGIMVVPDDRIRGSHINDGEEPFVSRNPVKESSFSADKVDSEDVNESEVRSCKDVENTNGDVTECDVRNCDDVEAAKGIRVVDTFRHLHPSRREAFTCWNTRVNARATNYGTRIDYVLCDRHFFRYVTDAVVHSHVLGSDHCPVSVVVSGLSLVCDHPVPTMCTRFYPEFHGSQQKLSTYFATQKENRSLCSASEGVRESKRRMFEEDIAAAKRPKAKDRAAKARAKQGTLLSFLGKTPAACGDSKVEDSDSRNSASRSSSSSFDSSGCIISSQSSSNGDCSQSSGTSDSQSSNVSCSPGSRPYQGSSDSDHKTAPEPNSQTGSEMRSESKTGRTLTEGSSWGFLMKKVPPPPLCSGHQEPSVVRTVKKKGPTQNRRFYSCARGVGKEGNASARCDFFRWVSNS